MADTPQPVEINGLVFASTGDGHLLESEVRRHVEALQREIADLQGRLEHVTSLERLAQATVMKADDMAVEIETEARRRVDQMIDECETEMVERRRQFEIESGAQQAAAAARVAQLQTALEGTLQTLGRALQAAGAPALEMPAASAPAWTPPAATPSADPSSEATGLDEVREEAAPAAALLEDEAADSGVTPLSATAFAVEPMAAEPAPIELEPSLESAFDAAGLRDELSADEPIDGAKAANGAGPGVGWGSPAYEPAPTSHDFLDVEPETAPAGESAPPEGAAEHGGSSTFELSRPSRPTPEPIPIRPSVNDRADDEPVAAVAPDAGPSTLSRIGPATIEIDMRPVKSFADLARVTKLLGRIAPGAQPVDLNLPQHRALFSVRAKDPQALAAQLQEALPDAKVVEREDGLDVLLEGGE